MKKLKTKLPWLFAGLALVAALIYGYWPAAVPVDVTEVTRGSFDVTVDDDGETRIREKYVVSAPVGGKLLRVQLHAGDSVTRGMTELTNIEPNVPDLMDARMLAEASARLRAAEANVERSREILVQANTSMELATQHYARAQDLLPQKAMSQSEFDEIEQRYHFAEAAVRAATFSVNVATFELEHAQAAVARYDESTEAGDDTFVLISPIDGVVLRVFKEDAGVVAPGEPILELGDPRDLELKIDVLSTDAVKIRAGQRVLIEHWGGETMLEARVRRVEPSAFLKVSALGVEEQRVNIIADFLQQEDLPSVIGDGYRVEARIVVQSADDSSLSIPAGALFRHGDDWQVYRVVQGRAELRTVVPGMTNGTVTEIIEGLEESDQVILHPTERIVDGVSVKARNIRY